MYSKQKAQKFVQQTMWTKKK